MRTISTLWKDYSFPSGHTAAAFSVAAIFALNFPAVMYNLAGLAALVGVSRMYMGQHYPTDVAIGALLGAGSGAFIHYLRFF